MGRVLLVRHGQASFGADDYDVLSPVGWEQGRMLGRHLAAAGVAPTSLARGAMRRHRETLEALCEGAGWTTPPREDARLDEFDHVSVVAAHPEFAERGADHDRRSFQVLFEEATTRWAAGVDAGAGESYLAFRARVQAGLLALADEAGPGRTVLAVTSGGVVAALAAALILDVDLTAPPVRDDVLAGAWQRLNAVCVNTGLSGVVVGSSGPRLLTFNEHEHLDAGALTYR